MNFYSVYISKSELEYVRRTLISAQGTEPEVKHVTY